MAISSAPVSSSLPYPPSEEPQLGILEKKFKTAFPNLSQRTLAATKDTDANILPCIQRDSNRMYHIASMRKFIETAEQKIDSIFTPEDKDLLFKEGLLTKCMIWDPATKSIKTKTQYSLKMSDLRKVIIEKDEKGEPLSTIERAAKHFILDQVARASFDAIQALLKSEWKEYKTTYDPTKNGAYPFRDMEGNDIGILSIESSKDFNTKDIHPFISKKKNKEERAALYDEYLHCRPFTESDQKSPYESSLVEQNMVIAKKTIPANQCIGVYGGVLLSKKDVWVENSDDYTFEASNDRSIIIDGDNILCRINTIFNYDAEGKPCKQADEGYNVEAPSFLVTLAENMYGASHALLTSIFTTCEIPAGQELRLDYCYDKETIKRKFPGMETDPQNQSTTS